MIFCLGSEDMKRKLNPLPLSLRERKRYLLFSFKKTENAEKEINYYLQAFFGIYGMAQMELKVERVIIKEDKAYAIIRTSRDMYEKVIAALELNKDLDFKLEKVSGTIKTIKHFLGM